MCADGTDFFISNSDHMLTERQKEQFIPQIEEIIKEGLKRLKVIDILHEKGNVFPHRQGKFSEQNLDLDYQSLDIEIHEHTSHNGIHTFNNVWWITPYRIVKNGYDKQDHKPGKSFWGAIPEIKVKADYDQDTDTLELTLLNDFVSSAEVRQ